MNVAKAVVLAAGRGVRMRELTQKLPKPMLPVKGKPILEWILTGIRNSTGIRQFFLVTGYQAEVIETHFGDGTPWGVLLAYGRQEVQNGTGKAVEVAKEWVGDEPFLLAYGDILVESDAYRTLVAAYEPEGVLACVAREDLNKGGAVFLDAHGRVQEILEKPAGPVPPGAYYNAGIYVLSPAIFTFTQNLSLSPRGEYELTDALRTLAQKARLKGVLLQCPWVDVRDPEIFAEVR
jgi:NDP-sugar pyrophosphorylase family protein